MSIEDIFEPNKIVYEVTEVLRNRIIELEKENNIPTGYLKTALALHIPKFSEEEIYAEGNVEFQAIYIEAKRLSLLLKKKIESLPVKFQKQLIINNKLSKIKNNKDGIVEVDINGKETKVEFRELDKDLGFLIQEKLHYIGQPREDTLLHFGLYRDGEEYPFAYSAYSILDRKYLHDSLPFDSDMKEILVLTRSFSVNNSPINSMSLLFGEGMDYIQKKYNKKFKAVITAINPNTLFKGTVFKGSAFFTFATVPFLPTYYKGNYLTRKSMLELGDYSPNELKGAQIDCKPTIWMGHGLSKNAYLKLRESQIINISKESYLAG